MSLISLLELEESKILELALDCCLNVSQHSICIDLFEHLGMGSKEIVSGKVLDRLGIINEIEILEWAPLLRILSFSITDQLLIVKRVQTQNALLCLCESFNSEAVGFEIFTNSNIQDPKLAYACLTLISKNRIQMLKEWARLKSVSERLFLNSYFAPMLSGEWLLSETELFEALKSSERNSRRTAKSLLEEKYQWTIFWQIFDSVDEYASNLFKSIFNRFAEPATDQNPGASNYHWFLLLCRCLSHENPFVIKHTVSVIVEDSAIGERVVSILSEDPDRLIQFCKYIEVGWVKGFNNVKVSGGLSLMIGSVLSNVNLLSATNESSPLEKFIHYVVWEAKTYFPIIYCYWEAISSKRLDVNDEIRMDINKFLETRIFAFSSIVRPCLRNLIHSFDPQSGIPFVEEVLYDIQIPLDDPNELLTRFAELRGREILSFNKLVEQRLAGVTEEFMLQYISIATGLVLNRNKENIGLEEVDSILRIVFSNFDSTSEIVNARMKFVRVLMDIGLRANALIGRHGIESFILNLKYVLNASDDSAVLEFLADLVMYKEGINSEEVEGAAMVGIGSAMVDESSAMARILTLEAIASLDRNDVAENVIRSLLSRIVALQKTVPIAGPLPFSQIHRTQLRIGQAVLFLIPKTSAHFRITEVAPLLFQKILQWNNQPDVRDYFEILAIYMCRENLEILEKYLAPVLENFSLSSQSTASFIVVASFFTPKEGLVPLLTPYLTSNVSYIRGIVQKWIFENASQIFDESILRQIEFLKLNKEAIAMRRRLSCVYNEYDPSEYVGRIFSTSKHGEFVPSEIFLSAIRQGVHAALETNWHYTRQQSDPVVEAIREVPHVLSDAKNSQKKYRPESQLGSVFQSNGSSRNSSELIVVTSLLDKTTNIAGLCRSAEVFGASTLVVSSLSVLKDPTFQSMAVTAEHWINVLQVTPVELEAYTFQMRKKGYTIVCLEQTHSSVEIQNYKFDPKTVLILGNEKSGINMEHIHLMDVCVEIPQKGIIRSLNVHVSGAIAIYHYNRTAHI